MGHGFDPVLLGGGHYARKQVFCRDAIIAWSHRSRFRLARRLVEPHRGGHLLDYGCGDGTFVALVHDLFPKAVGVDEDPQQTADCRRRFSELPGLSFVHTDELSVPRHDGLYDVVVCMEVLEHCVESKLGEVIGNLWRLVSPDGRVIISVPIEIGPTLLGKQAVRTLAGWRGLGDYRYRERYTVPELWRMFWAGSRTEIHRPVFRADFGPDRPNLFHGHKGFNWRALRARLGLGFVVERARFSPLGWLGGYLSSQAWLICRRRLSRAALIPRGPRVVAAAGSAS